MIQEPTCFKKGCSHYLGILQTNNVESIELPYCKIYSEGISDDIVYGNKRCDELRTPEPDPEQDEDWGENPFDLKPLVDKL